MIHLIGNVRAIHHDITKGIDAFQKSLYEQKHAFHFRKIHEWHDYSKVGYELYNKYANA